MNVMVITNQKTYNRYTKKMHRKEYKPNTKESHQITGEENKKERNREELKETIRKTMNKVVISTYLSMITLNVNRLNAGIKMWKL